MRAKEVLGQRAVSASADGLAVSVMVGGQWLKITAVEVDGEDPDVLIGCIEGCAIYIDLGAVQAVRAGTRV